MRISHKTMITVSGIVWLAAGFILLRKGLHLLAQLNVQASALPLAAPLIKRFNDVEIVSVLLIAVAIILGFIKGRTAMASVVTRVVDRIGTLPNPAPVFRLFGKGYLLLLVGGVMMGWLVNCIGLTNDIRGVIDVAVGAALIQGASQYFRVATQ